LSDIATIAGLLAGGADWKMTGVRIGAMRAVSLALKTKLIGDPIGGVKSIRVSQIGKLNQYLKMLTRDFYMLWRGLRVLGNRP
jgi:hypothetical protein